MWILLVITSVFIQIFSTGKRVKRQKIKLLTLFYIKYKVKRIFMYLRS
jgi:hypothetical protein